MGTGQDQTGADRSKGWTGAEVGLLSTTCRLLLVFRALALRVATSTQLFIHLTSSPNLGLTALWVLRVRKQMAQPSLLFWLRGPGSQPLFPFCLPTTCLAPHTTLFCLWDLPLVSQVEAPPTLKSQVPPFSSIFHLRECFRLTFILGLGVLYGEEPGGVGARPCLGDRQQQ